MGTGNVGYYQLPGLHVTDQKVLHRTRTAEALDVIESLELGFNLGNVVKYIIRHGRKPGVPKSKDLKKAMDYLERQIHIQDRLEAKEILNGEKEEEKEHGEEGHIQRGAD